MKFINSREFETVSNALNFSTPDLLVAGSCDLYTTKAARHDKKLYKSIDKSLESQHESLLRLSASLSPPQSQLMGLNLSRSSPFGPLTEVSNRRTFAYLIATLNATHPDYDFTDVLQPSDFQKEKNIQSVMSEIDDLLYSLRPRSIFDPVTVAHSWSGGKKGMIKVPHTPGGTPAWNGRMWSLIDDEMRLLDCEIFRYQPSEDPFDDEGALWSMHFFIFNKMKKRVAYFYVRGLSVVSHSPDAHFTTIGGLNTPSRYNSQSSRNSGKRPTKRGRETHSISVRDTGASKRAKFWLGDQVNLRSSEPSDVVDETNDLGLSWDNTSETYSFSEDGSVMGDESEEEEDDEIEARFREKGSSSRVRGMSEEMTANMDL